MRMNKLLTSIPSFTVLMKVKRQCCKYLPMKLLRKQKTHWETWKTTHFDQCSHNFLIALVTDLGYSSDTWYGWKEG